MPTYLLNSPVLTAHGRYDFKPLSVEAAREVLSQGFESAVGHASTAQVISELLGIDVPCRRVSIAMQPGDRAVVFRLRQRPEEGKILSPEELLASEPEWGLLTALTSVGAEPGPGARPGLRAFLSYSRDNHTLAEQLYNDLGRAGVDVWVDRKSIPLDSAEWSSTIDPEIESRELFLLLTSPEANASKQVRRELETAERFGRTIIRLRVGGSIDDLPDDLTQAQLTDFAIRPYHVALRDLLAQAPFQVPQLPLLFDWLEASGTEGSPAPSVAEIAAILGDGAVKMGEYWKLPLYPSAYSMTWLVAPAADTFGLPKQLGFAVTSTGPIGRTLNQVLEHRRACEKDAWALAFEGFVPKDSTSHDIPFGSAHIWEEHASAVIRCLQSTPFYEREMDLYLDCPTVLAFEIGSRNRGMGKRNVYAFNRDAKEPRNRYREIPWGAGSADG